MQVNKSVVILETTNVTMMYNITGKIKTLKQRSNVHIFICIIQKVQCSSRILKSKLIC